jgi:hypothetical protein
LKLFPPSIALSDGLFVPLLQFGIQILSDILLPVDHWRVRFLESMSKPNSRDDIIIPNPYGDPMLCEPSVYSGFGGFRSGSDDMYRMAEGMKFA